MKIAKEEKGITLITLVVAIALMVIIAGILLYNSRNYSQISRLDNLNNDIQILKERVQIFYSTHGSLPVVEGKKYTVAIPDEQKNPNDGTEYYLLNLDVLEDVRLNYGKDFEVAKNASDIQDYTDLYIINGQSQTIYYVKGVSVDNVMYYTDNTQYVEVD